MVGNSPLLKVSNGAKSKTRSSSALRNSQSTPPTAPCSLCRETGEIGSMGMWEGEKEGAEIEPAIVPAVVGVAVSVGGLVADAAGA